MKKYVILPDITCDLSEEIRREFQLEDYLPGHVHISDGRDFRTVLDWSLISRDEFYKTLSNKRIQVSSAPPSPEEYYLKFKEYAEAGVAVLSMSISSKISSTYNIAAGAAARVKEENAQAQIYCFDSFKMSGAFGLLVMHALRLQSEGKSFEEVVEYLESAKHRVHQMGPIDDLVFVARRGQITMGKAIMGNFAGVKPMGDCSRDGYVSVLTKVKGIGRALDLTVDYLAASATDLSEQFVLISHSHREEYANRLKELLEARTDVKKVYISDVFSGCGTNIGSGMIGVYFLGEPITEDLSREKEIMNTLVNG